MIIQNSKFKAAEGVFKKLHSLRSLIMNLDSGFPRNWKLIDEF